MNMSQTELYIIKKDGSLKYYKGFGNSHRGASLLWSNLCKKYLTNSYGIMMFNDNELEKLWKLDRDPKVPEELRILHISTFDRMMIRKENLQKFIEAIKKVQDNNYFEDLGHFDAYPEVFEEIEEITPDIIGIAWNQTSVNSGYWDIYEKCPHCKEETIRRDYNIFKDQKHDFLFEYLYEIRIKLNLELL